VRWLALLLAGGVAVAPAATLTLGWHVVPDARVTGYEVGWGAYPGSYTNRLDVTHTGATIVVPDGAATYIAVRALGVDGTQALVSAWSAEVQWPSGATRPLRQDELFIDVNRLSLEISMTVEQSAHGHGTGILSYSVSLPSTPTTGRLIVVLLRLLNGFSAFVTGVSVEDNQGNTYTERVARGGYQNDTRIYTAPVNTASGTFTVTATYDVGGNTWATGGINLVVVELSGADNTDPVDQADNATGTATTWGVTLPTMASDTTVFTVCGNTWDATPTATGWETIATQSEDGGFGAFYRVGDYDPAGSWNISDSWSCAGLGVSAGASAAASLPPVRSSRVAHLLVR
jgi:hypothetical protein